jgi:hypothetical protein
MELGSRGCFSYSEVHSDLQLSYPIFWPITFFFNLLINRNNSVVSDEISVERYFKIPHFFYIFFFSNLFLGSISIGPILFSFIIIWVLFKLSFVCLFIHFILFSFLAFNQKGRLPHFSLIISFYFYLFLVFLFQQFKQKKQKGIDSKSSSGQLINTIQHSSVKHRSKQKSKGELSFNVHNCSWFYFLNH